MEVILRIAVLFFAIGLASQARATQLVRCNGQLLALDYALSKTILPFGNFYEEKKMPTTPFLTYMLYAALFAKIAPQYQEPLKMFFSTQDNETDFSKPIVWQPNDLPLSDSFVPLSQLPGLDAGCADRETKMVQVFDVVRKSTRGKVIVYEYDRKLRNEIYKSSLQKSFMLMSVFLESYRRNSSAGIMINALLHSESTISRPIDQLRELGNKFLLIKSRAEICSRSHVVVMELQRKLGIPCEDLSSDHLLEIVELTLKGKGRESSSFSKNDFDGLRNLENLRIENFENEPAHIVSEQIKDLTKLRFLAITGSQIDETPKGFMSGPFKLFGLDLSGNNIYELKRNAFRKVFADVVEKSQKIVLNLSKNTKFNEPRRTVYIHPGAFNGCETVTDLILHDSNISDISSEVFEPLQGLLRLDVSNNRIRRLQSVIDSMSLSRLQTLDLSGNPFSKLSSEEFRFLTKLEELRLEDNNLQEFPEFLFSLPKLRKFSFCGRNFSASDYDVIGLKASKANPNLEITFCKK